MKKLFFFAVIFLALPMRAQVLDTIYWGHPNYYMYPEWIMLDSVNSFQLFAKYNDLPGFWWQGSSANERAVYCHVNKGIQVLGLAAVVHWDTTEITINSNSRILDSSLTDCFEYLRLYRPTGNNQLDLLAEGTFHAESPSHVMQIPYAIPCYGPYGIEYEMAMQNHLVYEVMFDNPITVDDSCYIGYTWYNSKLIEEGGNPALTHWPILYGEIWSPAGLFSYGPYDYYDRNDSNSWSHSVVPNNAVQTCFSTVFLIVATDTVEYVDTIERCRTPSYLAMRSRTDYDMALDWQSVPYAEAYDAVVVPWRDDPSTGVIRTTTANNQSFIGYGLQQGIYYAAYVRTRCHHECDIHDTVYYSDWSQPLYFFLGDTEPTDSPYAGVSTLAENSVKLVPNPASDQAMITSSFGINGIEVYSLKGELMEHSTRNGGTVANIDLQRYPAGAYIVRIRTAKGIVARHLEVVR
ncbi:MAG: T9SS type A sorting domain-containing protein [Bacteroidales bacterium]|nr:T9SS type A sorting domain-containing protein [Bacteroidales bacterium]